MSTYNKISGKILAGTAENRCVLLLKLNLSLLAEINLSWDNFEFLICTLWQYRFWSFQTGYTKLERFMHKKQQTQRKLLNFENWTNEEPQ